LVHRRRLELLLLPRQDCTAIIIVLGCHASILKLSIACAMHNDEENI